MTKLNEYSVYDEDGELIDVLTFSEKDVRKYKKTNPNYTVEIIEDEEDNE